MKSFILIAVVLTSLCSIQSYADRFPGGEPGDECRAGNPEAEDCGEGTTCEVVAYEEDLDYPGIVHPIYGCVEAKTSYLSKTHPNRY